MNLIYRNVLDQEITFTLGSISYCVRSGDIVEIPEKYDYAIEAMGINLEKDYEQSIVNDSHDNPERWESFLTPFPEQTKSEEVVLKKTIRERKKKVTDGV